MPAYTLHVRRMFVANALLAMQFHVASKQVKALLNEYSRTMDMICDCRTMFARRACRKGANRAGAE